jgi:hypothetical protein
MTVSSSQVDEFEESTDPRENLLRWVRNADGQSVTEASLPGLLAAALAARRAEQLDRTLQVIAFRVVRDGQEITRVGPAQTQDSLAGLVALSVVVVTADDTALHVDAYTLAALDRRA